MKIGLNKGIADKFLYEAIFIPEGVEAPPMEIINQPELQVYVDGFGTKDGDIAFVAEIDGIIAGEVWVALLKKSMRRPRVFTSRGGRVQEYDYWTGRSIL